MQNNLYISSDMKTSHVVPPLILLQNKYARHPFDNLLAYTSIQNCCQKQTLKEYLVNSKLTQDRKKKKKWGRKKGKRKKVMILN